MNIELEPICRESWELNTKFNRLGLRNRPGPKPEWAWNQKNGKLGREKSKGGIDWWRYYNTILKAKLIPFVKECMKDHPGILVQEDKAPAHAYHFQERVYAAEGVKRFIWCSNSPDLNAIEPAWPYMKRFTTKKGAPTLRKEADEAWTKCWKELPQSKIQAWIERIPEHIERIIECEGGNEYKEGRAHRIRTGDPEISDDGDGGDEEESQWVDIE